MSLSEKIQSWILNTLEKLKNKLSLEEQLKFLKKKEPQIRKLIENTIKKNVFVDELILTLYGPNSQIYIDWHDKLNILSIDIDQPDTEKSEHQK